MAGARSTRTRAWIGRGQFGLDFTESGRPLAFPEFLSRTIDDAAISVMRVSVGG